MRLSDIKIAPKTIIVGIDALNDKGLRRNHHIHSSSLITVGIDALNDKGRGKEGSWEIVEALRDGFKRLRRERRKLGR